MTNNKKILFHTSACPECFDQSLFYANCPECKNQIILECIHSDIVLNPFDISIATLYPDDKCRSCENVSY